MKKPLVSIIVTNFNGERYLKKCFHSLCRQSYPNIELILADDGSTDKSIDIMKKYFPKVKLAVNPKNAGLSAVSNRGAKLAHGKYLFFYNNDTIAFSRLIEEMINTAESDGDIGVVCPVQLSYNPKLDKKRDEYQKDIGVGSDIYGYICSAKDSGHIFYPDAAIFIRKEVFRKIGGFDNDFFLYGEDMDLCWRVHLLGYVIKPSMKAKFRHDSFCGQLSNGKVQTSYTRRALVERQVINKLIKYYKPSTLIWLLPKFCFYYTLESLYFLIIKRNWKMFASVYLHAIWWNIVALNKTLKKRRFIQRIRKVNDRYILDLMYPKYRKLEGFLKLGTPEVN